jgi:hypothetical protein
VVPKGTVVPKGYCDVPKGAVGTVASMLSLGVSFRKSLDPCVFLLMKSTHHLEWVIALPQDIVEDPRMMLLP